MCDVIPQELVIFGIVGDQQTDLGARRGVHFQVKVQFC